MTAWVSDSVCVWVCDVVVRKQEAHLGCGETRPSFLQEASLKPVKGPSMACNSSLDVCFTIVPYLRRSLLRFLVLRALALLLPVAGDFLAMLVNLSGLLQPPGTS